MKINLNKDEILLLLLCIHTTETTDDMFEATDDINTRSVEGRELYKKLSNHLTYQIQFGCK